MQKYMILVSFMKWIELNIGDQSQEKKYPLRMHT